MQVQGFLGIRWSFWDSLVVEFLVRVLVNSVVMYFVFIVSFFFGVQD